MGTKQVLTKKSYIYTRGSHVNRKVSYNVQKNFF